MPALAAPEPEWTDPAWWRRVAFRWAVVLAVTLVLLAATVWIGGVILSNRIGLAWAQAPASRGLDSLMVAVTTLGAAEVTYPLLLVLCLTARRDPTEPRWARWLPLLVMVGANVVELGGKLLVPQPGPAIALHRGVDLGLLVPGTAFSFPSGHVLRATMVYGVIGLRLARRTHHLVWLVGTIALVWLIGYSRIYLGFHWPADVAGGLLLGGLGLSVCLAIAPRTTVGVPLPAEPEAAG